MPINRETAILGAAGLAMIAVGAGCGVLGYLLMKKKLEAKYDAIAKDEIAKAREFYKVLNKEGKLSKPQNVRVPEEPKPKVVERIIKVQEYSNAEVVEEEISAPDFMESEGRNIESIPVPYVISQDDYMKNEDDYHQSTFTYYEEDDILLDENDNPIPNEEHDDVIGTHNLNKFGHGSRDNNVVYVRNEEKGFTFEIVRQKGSYARDVLGYIEHSEFKGPRRFRIDRE